MAGRPKELTDEQVKEALINARGLKTLAADALGVTFNTIERYIQASEDLQATVKSARHKRTDMAKSKLDEAIMRGEQWAVMFTLKNKTDPDGEFTGEKGQIDITSQGEKIEILSDEEKLLRMFALLKKAESK